VYRVKVYRTTGELCAEIEAAIPRSWVLNRAGQATFTLSTSDPKFRDDIIRFGNLILVESDAVPNWGGVIWEPFEWSLGTCSVTALGLEALLKGRWTEPKAVLRGTTGEVFKQLIGMANAWGGYTIKLGSVWGGPDHRHKVKGELAYDSITALSDDTGGDWWLEPVEEAGRLVAHAHWAEQRGVSTTFGLHLDLNCEAPSGPLLSQQGPVVNYIFAYGQGATLDETPQLAVWDDESIARHGLWQALMVFPAKSEAELRVMAEAALEDRKELFSPFTVVALPVGDAFEHLRLGNFVDLSLPGVGFNPDGTTGVETRVRVTGMSYDETDGKMPLILAEVVE
jgi:hypothetical protein